jgi:hypothetical protein
VGYQTVTIQLPTPVAFLELSRCLFCYALVEKNEAWRHDAWHSGVDQPQPVVVERVVLAGDDVVAAVKHHIDGLYILLGEDPPFNEIEPAHAPRE